MAYPVLCGGTFFSLVLKASTHRLSGNQRYHSEKDALSETNNFVALGRVANPDYEDVMLTEQGAQKSFLSEYKKGGNSGKGKYAPFGEPAIRNKFDELVRKHDSEVLDRMRKYVADFIDCSKTAEKHITLSRELIDLVIRDETIDCDQELYIYRDKEPLKKSGFDELKSIEFEPFLLGIFHFIVVERYDPRPGKDTYNAWFPSLGGNKRGEYCGELDADRDIEVHLICESTTEFNEQSSSEASSNAEDEMKAESETEQDDTAQKEKAVINVAFIQNGANSTQNVINKPVNINISKKE